MLACCNDEDGQELSGFVVDSGAGATLRRRSEAV